MKRNLVAVVAVLVLLTVYCRAGEYRHEAIAWREIAPGLYFANLAVTLPGNRTETVAILKIDPRQNRIRVLNSFEPSHMVAHTIDEWQKLTAALAVINGGQYMAEPYLMPCALVLCDGVAKGPRSNENVRGMLVAEPRDPRLPLADLLDFEYDRFDPASTKYTQGLQHWPILLDRKGKIRVRPTPFRANRSVVAKDTDGNLLFMNTLGPQFTLNEFAQFLKASNDRPDKGLRIQTAMNLDGGHEANMIIRAGNFSYENYGQTDAGDSFNLKVPLPGVIAVFPRNK